MDTGPHFDDDQIRQILSAAADRQEAADRAAGRAPSGLSLDELKRIGSEAGIDPEHVEAAATDLVRYGRTESTALAPASKKRSRDVVERRMIPAAVSEEEWGHIVLALRDTFGRTGVTTQFGQVREWVSHASESTSTPIVVRVEPGESGALVTINQSTNTARELALIGPMLFGTIAVLFPVLTLLGDVETAWWVFVAIFGPLAGLTGAGGYALANAWAAKQHTKLKGLMDRIELIARGDDSEGRALPGS